MNLVGSTGLPDSDGLDSGVPGLYQLASADIGGDGAVTVVTPEQPYGWALGVAPHPPVGDSSRQFRVRVAVRVLRGSIGVGILLKDRTRFHRYESAAMPDKDIWQTVYLISRL